MKKILVVEDDMPIRNLYKEELIDEGYDVVTAPDGVVGYELFRKEKPDLITIDIKMPNMNGLELLDKIRKEDKCIPIIIYSAYGEFTQNFSTWAADEYLVKSSDLTEFKNRVRELLDRK
ncbi:MAG: Sporulation initiation phosphotransferase F [Actinobacteria bacterium ADurb.Bin346]|nr:MAG: Sporulation initiation phosphotransferase F [Actinobacteria bacterium ADurb.Bin346]